MRDIKLYLQQTAGLACDLASDFIKDETAAHELQNGGLYMNANRLKKSHLKTFVISITAITVIFASVGTMMVRIIKEWGYSSVQKEYRSFARGHSHSIGKALEAHYIVDGLLSDRIMSAARAVSTMTSQSTYDLKVLAITMGVDSIIIYDRNGIAVSSADEDYIGFSPSSGHPARDFYDSTLISHVGEIREDSVKGGLVKYGYMRLSKGGFIQVGISEAEIGVMMKGLDVSDILDEIKGTGRLGFASYAGRDYRIEASTDESWTGKYLEEEDRAAIDSGTTLEYTDGTANDPLYRVIVPVYRGNTIDGALIIGAGMKGTEDLIELISILGMFLLSTVFMVLFFMIITSYRKDKKLWNLAYKDKLTGLPNDMYLKEVLEEILDKSLNVAVLIVNIPDLRDISITFGYDTRNEIINEAFTRLSGMTRDGLTLYRFSEDRFVFLYEGYKNRYESRAVAMRIDDLFLKPFRINESLKYLPVQVGISDTEGKIKTADQLLKEASVSLGSIRSLEDSNMAFFDSYMENELQREEAIEEELTKLLQGEGDARFYLVFQPLVSLENGRIIGFEALSRLESESLGLVMPMEFIRIAERKQLICNLGEVIFREACAFLRKLAACGHDGIKVAVNVSGIQLMKECFTEGVRDIVGRCGTDPSLIELEITESILMNDFEEINERLRVLRSYGIRIHLDDFGTGYSSLHRLRELQVDTLKIDRSFVSSIGETGEENSIIKDIISMAHRIGLITVAEGVETNAQKDYLKANGCDIYQGYLASPPLTKDKAIELLALNYTDIDETDENQTA